MLFVFLFLQAINCQNGSTSCPFCREYLPSSMDAHDHFVQCGSKTDQCPNCQLFIQRAVFAYHYENNCADINDIEISNGLNNSPSYHFSQFSPDNSKEKTPSTIPNIRMLYSCVDDVFYFIFFLLHTKIIHLKYSNVNFVIINAHKVIMKCIRYGFN